MVDIAEGGRLCSTPRTEGLVRNWEVLAFYNSSVAFQSRACLPFISAKSSRQRNRLRAAKSFLSIPGIRIICSVQKSFKGCDFRLGPMAVSCYSNGLPVVRNEHGRRRSTTHGQHFWLTWYNSVRCPSRSVDAPMYRTTLLTIVDKKTVCCAGPSTCRPCAVVSRENNK